MDNSKELIRNKDTRPENGGIKTHSPEMYARANKGQKHSNLSVLNLSRDTFNKDADNCQQVLDIGCGPGDFTRDDLLPRCMPCRRVVATDVSTDMLDFAIMRNSHPMIVYELLDIGGDVSGFLSKYGQFERVYSFQCLHWTNQKRAFENISSLLAPGGECLLHYPARTSSFRWWKEIVQVERWSKYREVVENAIPKTQYLEDKEALISYVTGLLKAAKLTTHTCDVLSVVAPKIVATPQAMLEAVLATNPVVPLLTAEERREFSEEMDRLMRNITASNKAAEPRMSTFDSFLVHASKASP